MRDLTHPHVFATQLIFALEELPDQDALWDCDSAAMTARSEGGKGELDISAAYDDVVMAPEEAREGRLKEWARKLALPPLRLPDSWDDAKTRVRACLLTEAGVQFRHYVESARDRTPGWPVRRELAGPLLVGTCIDSPERVTLVDVAAARRWKADPEKIAIANLRDIAETGFTEFDKGLWVCHTGDGFDAARILVPEAIRKLRIEGKPVALVPRRDLLLVAGDESPGALRRAGALAMDDIRQSRRLAGVALRLEGETWREWMPPKTHEAWPEFRCLRSYADHLTYAEQAAFYRAWYPDHWVAAVEGVVLESGEYVTGCTWPDRAPCILPQTDLFRFKPATKTGIPHRHRPREYRAPQAERGPWLPKQPRRRDAFDFPDSGGGGEGRSEDRPVDPHVYVPWAAFVEVLGSRLVDADAVPPRFIVWDPLTNEDMAALCAYAV